MQKLDRRNTYTPPNTAPVRCNCDPSLKVPRGKDGVVSLKTLSNNSEEHLLQPAGGHKADTLVFVINKNGNPLMPCKPAKARHLLEAGRAEVVQQTPFTIRLLWDCEENTQDTTLGIDAGYTTVGFSTVTSDRELIAGELTLRSDIKRLIEKRRTYRRTRRARLWHREPRFNNRGIPKGWLAPNIQHKLNNHIKLIEKLKKILPITKIVIEVASFDAQKMQNPEISGIEYQQGELQGYEVREYLLEKWGRKCAYCGKKDVPLEIEHIVPRSRGGSDRVSNLTIACHECNQAKGNQTAGEFGHPEIQSKAEKTLKATAFMNAVRSRIVDLLNCNQTYGYTTKYNRIKLGLEKSHATDAFVIAGGNGQMRSDSIIISKQVRRQNRSLYKANLLKGGRLKRNTVKEVKGFRRYDKVKYNNNECFIHGLRSSGYFGLRTITGDQIGASVNSKKLTLLKRAKGVIQEVCAIPARPCGLGLLAQVR
ncbi:MAG: HNH endonuclease [Methanosarcinales archaeon]|uniref:HNH endonuclease n=1 Tax=Candidatus Ethanoperedens thermophilum TaxID=2766897 RepID=A0A848DBC4_9EURY|nr:HNH endonuclease [Candidatus Ethanoperedens thermophilum]